jgi:DNA-binding PadR family transcriptional regulator
VQGGRARKYFSLTAAGARALRHSTAMLARMMAGLSPDLRGRS